MSKPREAKRGEKAELVRKLIGENPGVGNKDLAEMFNVKAKELGIDMTAREDGQEFAQAKSDAKKKAAEQPKTAAAATAAKPGEPTASELMKVKQLAEQVGGMDRLRACVDFWQRAEKT